MESNIRDPPEEIESYNVEIEEKRVSLLYALILIVPIILYSLILVILSIITSLEFLSDGWQIWTFIFMVPGLGFLGGFFLRHNELQKTLFITCLFLVAFTALVTSSVSGGLEIIRGSSSMEILLAFIGGILYGGGFGLVDCILLILTSLASYYLMRFLSQKQNSKR
ncbi:MAG: hypothetical protein JW776_13555 [Candidatus Lokiarchaeota archaeon]|nr:hypothetical protein [Candidatus Lokiarchaeota archaeon]